jgi:twitching motility protein PilT
MKTIEDLLKNLSRPEVLEFGLVTNRLPSVNIGGKFEPVDDEAPSTERLMQMLVTVGGSRYIDTLSDKPVQWTTRLDGVGVIAVAAIMRKEIIQARFTVAKRESAKAVPVTKPVSAQAPAARPGAPPPLPKPGAAAPQAVTHSVMPRAPSLSPAELPLVDATKSAAPAAVRGADEDITLQTLAPPVKAPIAGTDDARPKPARRPDEASLRPEEAKPAHSPGPLPVRRPITPTAVDVVDLDAAKAEAAGKARAAIDPSAGVDVFLAMAVQARATDLFIVAGRPVALRIATELAFRTQPIAADHVERMAKDVVPARLRDLLEREGACSFAVEHPAHGRFRVNASKQRTGLMLGFRVIAKELPTLEEIGLSSLAVGPLLQQPGLVLVSAPSGHGKSTTLAALVDHLNRETVQHIMTVEDPIEHVHPRKQSLVSQRDLALHGRSRARMLRSTLHEDVDTLVLGEIGDVDSMRHALVACERGRRVLGTMNAPSATKTVDRVLELFSTEESTWARARLAASLRLVVGQRLVPSADRTRFHAAVETLPWSVDLFSLIREGRTFQISELQKRGRSPVHRRLDESLAELVRARKTTAEIAKQLAEAPAELDALVARPAATAAAPARKV